MKLAKLINSTDRMRRFNARYVKVVAFKTGRDKQGLATAIAKTWTPREYKLGRERDSRDRNRYVSSIKFLDDKLNVKVSCSCPDYTFSGAEYANWRAGAADIIYGNGEPPREKRPGLEPGLCKHLVALRLLVKSKHGV